MTGPIYDLDSLKRGLVTIESNIEALAAGLDKERAKKAEYEKHIAAAELILEMHRKGMPR